MHVTDDGNNGETDRPGPPETLGRPEGDAPDMLAAMAPTPVNAGYRVLARKYRPANFDDLIGQDAMVRTLTNAFAAGRIAQAYMLTGVRGVGKTTTARILARALNYEPKEPAGDGESNGPTVTMPELGVHCAAIMESRHPDVVEMDAASHTGIDDIREIIEHVRYRPMSARFKVIIIDEVHMLSRQAFNGLLKTLEEPPEHARFIFATTEIRKVPVTVLSRCQRFDLRRIPVELLIDQFRKIAGLEGADVTDEALALIARAAEGSSRDGLSLLDQAIVQGAGEIGAETVRQMLGLADRARVIDLFEAVMAGRTADALTEIKAQYEAGADPQVVLSDMAEFVHLVTRAKVAGAGLDDPSLPEAARDRAKGFAENLDMAELARAWQMLLKGIGEVEASRHPLAAADMVLVRLAYATDLPPPGDLVRRLEAERGREVGSTKNAGPSDAPATAPTGGAPSPEVTSHAADLPASGSQDASEQLSEEPAPWEEPAPEETPSARAMDPAPDVPMPTSFLEAAALVGDYDIRLAHLVETSVKPVKFAAGHIEIAVGPEAPRDLAGRFRQTLEKATGRSWAVSIAPEGGGPTLREEREDAIRKRRADAETHPVVQAVMERFPDAEIVEVRDIELPSGDDEEEASRKAE